MLDEAARLQLAHRGFQLGAGVHHDRLEASGKIVPNMLIAAALVEGIAVIALILMLIL